MRFPSKFGIIEENCEVHSGRTLSPIFNAFPPRVAKLVTVGRDIYFHVSSVYVCRN